MTKEELWKVFASKNPLFEGDGNITLSKAGLKKLFDQTWEIAQDFGFENGKASKEKNREEKTPHNNYGDIFGQMFGGKK